MCPAITSNPVEVIRVFGKVGLNGRKIKGPREHKDKSPCHTHTSKIEHAQDSFPWIKREIHSSSQNEAGTVKFCEPTL